MIMLFDDLFYPGNPKKREEIRNYNCELRLSYEGYCLAWNKWAGLMNDAFSKCNTEPMHSKKIKLLTKDIQKDTLGDCMQEIKDVTADAEKTVKSVIDYMDLDNLLPKGWEDSGIIIKDMEKSKAIDIGKKISGACSTAIGFFAGYYIFAGVTVFTTLIAAATGIVASLGAMLGGLAVGLVVAAAGFVITDVISSAITGAVERKKLREAIELCEKLDKEVTKPLIESKASIEEFTFGIRNNIFELGDGYYIKGNSDGSYVIIKLADSSLNMKSQNKNVSGASIESKILRKSTVLEEIPFISVV
jgi:hypothetical protein